jgi:hypothetical protein
VKLEEIAVKSGFSCQLTSTFSGLSEVVFAIANAIAAAPCNQINLINFVLLFTQSGQSDHSYDQS